MEAATDSAVLVTVPAAEPIVGPHRARFDWAAARGVPAHVTVLYPFVPPAAIDGAVHESLAAAVATVPRFRAGFEATGWFGTEVLWLAPEPAERFRALTSAVMAAFPGYLPYGGEFDEIVPHLTVADDGEPEQLRAVEAQVRERLPIGLDVTAAELWCGSDAEGSWHQVATLPLGA